MVNPVTTQELAIRQGISLAELKQHIKTRRQAVVAQMPSIAAHFSKDPRAILLDSSSPYSSPYFTARNQLIINAMANPQNYPAYLEFRKEGQDAITEVQYVNLTKLLYNNGYITLVKVSGDATIDQAWAQSYIQSTPYETWLEKTKTVDLFNPTVPCIDWRYIMIGQSGVSAIPFINLAIVNYCNSANALIAGMAIGNSKLSRINLDASVLSSAIFFNSSLEALYYQFLRVFDGIVDPTTDDETPTQFQNCTLSLDAATYKAIQPNTVIWQNALFQDCTLTAFTFSRSYIESLAISRCQFIECPNAFDNAYVISLFFDLTSTVGPAGGPLLSLKGINGGPGASPDQPFPALITFSEPAPITYDGETTRLKNRTLKFADCSDSSTMYYPQQLLYTSLTFTIYQGATVYCYYDYQPLTGEALHQFISRTNTPTSIGPTPPAASSSNTASDIDVLATVESKGPDWFNVGAALTLLSGVLCVPKLLPAIACVVGGGLIAKETCPATFRNSRSSESNTSHPGLFAFASTASSNASSPYDTSLVISTSKP